VPLKILHFKVFTTEEWESMNNLIFPCPHFHPPADDTACPVFNSNFGIIQPYMLIPESDFKKRELNYTRPHASGSMRMVMYSLSVAFNNVRSATILRRPLQASHIPMCLRHTS